MVVEVALKSRPIERPISPARPSAEAENSAWGLKRSADLDCRALALVAVGRLQGTVSWFELNEMRGIKELLLLNGKTWCVQEVVLVHA